MKKTLGIIEEKKKLGILKRVIRKNEIYKYIST